MLSTKGTQALMARLKKDKSKLLNNLAQTHRNLVAAQFKDVVRMTPQWSGNLASNWYITFTGESAAYHQTADYGAMDITPYSIGMNPAVDATIKRELTKLSKIKYNTKVTFVNLAPYTSEVESGEGPNGKPIRPINYTYGPLLMTAFLEMKYKNLKTIRKVVNV